MSQGYTNLPDEDQFQEPGIFVYECHACRANDCKLWRPAHGRTLICWACLEDKGHKIDLSASDQIWDPKIESTNWLPAVPDLDGNLWGYTSVPHWWCKWWEFLPNKPTDCKSCNGSGIIEEFQCMFCKGTGIR